MVSDRVGNRIRECRGVRMAGGQDDTGTRGMETEGE